MDLLHDLLINTVIGLWQGNFVEKVMAVIFVVLILILLLMFVYAIVMIINTAFLRYEKGQAKVVSKIFKPAYTEHYFQTILISGQTYLIPMQRKVPDAYVLNLSIWDMSGELEVTKEMYEKISEGQTLKVKYAKNRLENKLSFKLDKNH